MFNNILKETRYIQEVIDPETKKHYNLHIVSTIPDNGLLAGFICNELYLTVSDPCIDILVGIGKKAFAPDEYNTDDEFTAALEKVIMACLPEGFKRYEAIMANGIEGNELKV